MGRSLSKVKGKGMAVGRGGSAIAGGGRKGPG